MSRLAALALMLVAFLAGCGRPDPTLILGKWRAESFVVEGLKLPIAPNIEVTRSELILRTPEGKPFQRLPISAIAAEGDRIELEFRDAFGVGLVFTVESKDRIRFGVPLTPMNVIYLRE